MSAQTYDTDNPPQIHEHRRISAYSEHSIMKSASNMLLCAYENITSEYPPSDNLLGAYPSSAR